jgi:hypothetical protein
MTNKVIPLPRYEIYKFSWGAAFKERPSGRWIKAFFPDGQELELENFRVELHEDGIEFLV